MAKRIKILMTLLFITVTTLGQTLDGFRYVYVPTLTYQNGSMDVWGICRNIRKQFEDMGFIVLNETSPIQEDLKNDLCKLITAKINHYSDPPNAFGGYYSHVELVLIDCNNESILSFAGKGKGANVQADFNIATRQINRQLSSLGYHYDMTKSPKLKLPEVEKTTETEESIKEYLSENKLDAIEGIYKSYQSEGMPYYKIGIVRKENNYKAIIIESEFAYWKPGEVKAVFEQSSMKGFYSVKWFMGNKTPFETFANMDNEALLSIELKDQNTGEKTQDKFIKMYPPADGDISFNKVQKSSGSGFFLTSNGIIATNAHVVENAEKINIQISNEIGNFEYSAKVLLVDTKNDVALIKIDDNEFKGLNEIPYSLIEKAEIGEKAFTIGYPLNDVMGTNYKVTDGIVSSISGIDDDMRYYQISVPLQPGNSGGPLFNSSGDVIGITSARLNSKAVGIEVENVNYAIKISYLLNLYDMLPNSKKLNLLPSHSSKELQDQVKILKNYVCLIKVN